jgi:putative ABC transport system ATP-binding protein
MTAHSHTQVQTQAGPPLVLKAVSLALGEGAARTQILEDVSLTVERGESVSVVGPSGSGKSTLLSVAAGLERADSGSVALLGQETADLSEDALARLRRGRVGFVFQSFHLADAMTAEENVMTAAEIAGHRGAREKARDALREVGLAERARHLPSQLSGGERQRVGVARALIIDPAIVFADEPTGNLDAKTGALVGDLLFRLARERGVTLVLVSHDESLAARSDRLVRMASGRLIP